MKSNEKERLINEIVSILQTGIKIAPAVAVSPETSHVGSQPLEMLTLKECTEVIKGVSEHTLRLLITQGKIPAIRTGEGKRGKILVSKNALVSYFN